MALVALEIDMYMMVTETIICLKHTARMNLLLRTSIDKPGHYEGTVLSHLEWRMLSRAAFLHYCSHILVELVNLLLEFHRCPGLVNPCHGCSD